jgi:hypothetical protein
MDLRYRHHYSRDEADALLPQIRVWLDRLRGLATLLEHSQQSVQPAVSKGCDVGGDAVNRSLRLLAETREVFAEFHQREIQLKDLDRGLVDFPAIIDGREVFLCWEECEDHVEYWHDLDSGFVGRNPI